MLAWVDVRKNMREQDSTSKVLNNILVWYTNKRVQYMYEMYTLLQYMMCVYLWEFLSMALCTVKVWYPWPDCRMSVHLEMLTRRAKMHRGMSIGHRTMDRYTFQHGTITWFWWHGNDLTLYVIYTRKDWNVYWSNNLSFFNNNQYFTM